MTGVNVPVIVGDGVVVSVALPVDVGDGVNVAVAVLVTVGVLGAKSTVVLVAVALKIGVLIAVAVTLRLRTGVRVGVRVGDRRGDRVEVAVGLGSAGAALDTVGVSVGALATVGVSVGALRGVAVALGIFVDTNLALLSARVVGVLVCSVWTRWFGAVGLGRAKAVCAEPVPDTNEMTATRIVRRATKKARLASWVARDS